MNRSLYRIVLAVLLALQSRGIVSRAQEAGAPAATATADERTEVKQLNDAQLELRRLRSPLSAAAEVPPERLQKALDPLPPDLQRRAQELLLQMQAVGSLARLPGALQRLDPARPEAGLAALRSLDVAHLPADLHELRAAVNELKWIEAFRSVLARPPDQPLDVKLLAAARRDLPEAVATPTRRIQADLAMKSFLDGYPSEARRILPDHLPPQQAAAYLADARTLALREGRVTTWPAARVLAPKPVRAVPEPRGPPPPPGIVKLLPAATPGSWEVAVSEAAPEPPLLASEAAELAQRLRTELLDTLDARQHDIRDVLQRCGGQVETLATADLRPYIDKAVTTSLAEVERRLGTPLNSSEHSDAESRLKSWGETPQAVADAIRNQRAAAMAKVDQPVSPPLTEAERDETQVFARSLLLKQSSLFRGIERIVGELTEFERAYALQAILERAPGSDLEIAAEILARRRQAPQPNPVDRTSASPLAVSGWVPNAVGVAFVVVLISIIAMSGAATQETAPEVPTKAQVKMDQPKAAQQEAQVDYYVVRQDRQDNRTMNA